MSLQTGVSMYFRENRIRIRNKAVSELGNPEYIHLYVDEKRKRLYLQTCERDLDAFRIYYVEEDTEKLDSFYINAKLLLRYLAKVIGVEHPEVSFRFRGVMLEDGQTIQIDLTQYEEIKHEGRNEDAC